MTKRKKPDGSDHAGDQSVPIPIQTFLWRQTRYDSKMVGSYICAIFIIFRLFKVKYNVVRRLKTSRHFHRIMLRADCILQAPLCLTAFTY